MRQKHAWREKWVYAAGSEWKRAGGQGTLSLVRSADDENGPARVLKELKSQRDEERRARMRREIVALETMPHPLTPTVLDHNTAAYKDVKVDLYAVFEFVPGPTLEEYVAASGGIPVANAIVLTSAILSILEHYHNQGQGHRDIKPDNIVIRDNDIASTVLIDFGLTFNTVNVEEELTPEWQTVGNRFLSLPEHVSVSENKRDLRSDITFCVGVFFFALTGTHPATLLDEASKLPHQRTIPRARLNAIAEPERLLIMQLFDQGFSANLGYRWQTIAALRSQLARISGANITENTTDHHIVRLREVAEAASGNQRVIDGLDIVRSRVEGAALNAVARLGTGHAPDIEKRLSSIANMNTWIRCGVNRIYEGRVTSTPFLISAVGDEIVVEELLRDARNIVARVPMQDPQGLAALHEHVVEIIINNVAKDR